MEFGEVLDLGAEVEEQLLELVVGLGHDPLVVEVGHGDLEVVVLVGEDLEVGVLLG